MVKMKPRNRFQIFVVMLDIAKRSVNKTKLIYTATTNFNLGNKYIEEMIKKGLLAKEGSNFYTTEKGKEFIENMQEYLL